MAKSLLDLASELKKSFNNAIVGLGQSPVGKALVGYQNTIPNIQQGITNWAAQNPNQARSVINAPAQIQRTIQNVPTQINTVGQNVLNKAYPQVQAPQWIPKPLTIPYQISQVGGQLAKNFLSYPLQRATVGTPEIQTLAKYGVKPNLTQQQIKDVNNAMYSEAMNIAMGMVAPIEKQGSNEAIQLLASKLRGEDIAKIGRFSEIVETTGGKGNLGQLGQEMQSLAKNVFGKDAATWSNQKLKNVFDMVLEKVGQGPNRVGLGLNARPLRSVQEAEKNINKGLSKGTGSSKVSQKIVNDVKSNLEQTKGPTELQSPQTNIAPNGGNGSGNKISSGQITSPDFNINRLNIPKEAKQTLKNVIEEVKPTIEKVTGKKLSNQEVVELSNRSAKVLNTVATRDQTAAWESALLKARQKLADSANNGVVDQEYINNLIQVKSQATDIARKLQSFSIGADPKLVGNKEILLDAVLKVEKDTAKVLQEAKGVDFNDYNQAVNFYRKFVKPSASEYIDTLRYNSMLSSPNTHINNAFSNLVNTAVVAPIEKSVTGMIDFLASPLRGGKRTAFAGEGPVYLKGYVSKIGEASHNFADVLRGKRASGNLDVRQLPLATEGAGAKLSGSFSLPQRLLEASDQFFTALTKGGEEASLNLKQSKGVKVTNLDKVASDNAAYRLFRSELKDPRQGTLLNGIDEITGLIMKARSSNNPIVSTISKLTLPFVKTPMNILKQGIEYSPAGVLTIPGASNKTEQIAKVIMGTSAATATAMLVASGRTTWAEPTDAKKKAAFRAAGMQPYSVKVGDNWVSYAKLPPALGFPVAFISALHDAEQNKLITQNQLDVILNATAKMGNFYADQSYLKNIGDIVAASKGDIEAQKRFISNYPQQLVPYRALLGWMARLTDPYQRKADTNNSFLENQVQQLFMQMPFLSQKVPARLDQFNQPIPNQNKEINAFSPLKVSTEKPEQRQYYDQLQQKTLNTKNTNALKDAIEQGKEIPNSIGVQAADKTEISPIEKQQVKMKEDLIKEQVKLTGNPQDFNGNHYYINDKDTQTSVPISLITPKEPSLTGDELLDKKLISQFTSEITNEANNVMERYQIGLIDQNEASRQLKQLEDLKDSFTEKNRKGSAKKISIPKISVPKIKVTLPKARKMTPIKIASPPKVKSAARKKNSYKISKIKTVKLKGLQSGKKLV